MDTQEKILEQDEISKIIIHCSDSPDDKDIGLQEINQWHKDRGFGNWKGTYCGYHYVIRKSGLIEVGRPEDIQGAHVKGHNKGSIGVCWIGRKQMPESQKEALLGLCQNLMMIHNLCVEDIMGHTEFNPHKTCPNFMYEETFSSIEDFRKELLNYINRR